MKWPSEKRALKLAAQLSVLNQKSGAMEPFHLNRAQRRVLFAALGTRRLVVGKGRQVGCSTVLAFLMLLLCIMNPGLPCCIVADDQAKADGLLRLIKAWARDLFGGDIFAVQDASIFPVDPATGQTI